MLNFFIKNSLPKRASNTQPLVSPLVTTDIHSHLLPGIDDGVQDLEEAEILARDFLKMGYKKLVTTPHVMQDFYRNTPEIIRAKLQELKAHLKLKNIPIEVEAAAEYYLDEYLIRLLDNNEEILTFGENYVLFETAFINKPAQLEEVVFMMQSIGYQPVLAHPERYVYFQQDISCLKKLYAHGLLLQVNLNSLSGYYSKAARDLAEYLIDQEMVQFIGSDCHNQRHLHVFKTSWSRRSANKLAHLSLRNDTL